MAQIRLGPASFSGREQWAHQGLASPQESSRSMLAPAHLPDQVQRRSPATTTEGTRQGNRRRRRGGLMVGDTGVGYARQRRVETYGEGAGRPAGRPGGRRAGGGLTGSASIRKSEGGHRSRRAAPHTVTPQKFLIIPFISVNSIAICCYDCTFPLIVITRFNYHCPLLQLQVH